VNERNSKNDYVKGLRAIFILSLLLFSFVTFILWKIDNPRVERIRIVVLEKIIPSFEWLLTPMRVFVSMSDGIESYTGLVKENVELRYELRRLKNWKEAAIRLEEENSKLLLLNNVRVSPNLKHITGLVLADSGSPYRRSVLLNVGKSDGVEDGWAVMDDSGLIGRLAGVGENLSRVILLIDSSSRLPIKIEPSGIKAIIFGDNTLNPPLEIIENRDLIRSGDRVVTSGDGRIFPSDILLGHVIRGPDQRLRVKLVADYQRLKFLKVMRTPRIDSSGLSSDIISNGGID
jgi:rod shape-determining protein MreC